MKLTNHPATGPLPNMQIMHRAAVSGWMQPYSPDRARNRDELVSLKMKLNANASSFLPQRGSQPITGIPRFDYSRAEAAVAIWFKAAASIALRTFKGAHVDPDLINIRQTFRFNAASAHICPPQRILSPGRPDRVLLFVIDEDFVDRLVICTIDIA